MSNNISQNLYDKESFFNAYSNAPRSKNGILSVPEYPYIKSILPAINQDTKVLDLGCGFGWFCRESIKMGAKSALGIDISKNMINKAKEFNCDLNENEKNKIKFEIQDLENLKLPNDELYDLIYSVYAFHYVESSKLEPLLNKVYSSLNKDGILLFTIEHPIITSSKLSKAHWIDYKEDGDDSGNKKVWPVSNYGEEGKRITNWCGTDGVVKYHRTIGTYINTLIKIGFQIQHVYEWTPLDAPQERVKEDPGYLGENGAPLILIIKATKN